VLRCADVPADDADSRLWEYLRRPVCVRALGFDPMVEIASVDDVVAGILAALGSPAIGVFNVGGNDVMPLSEVIHACGRASVPFLGTWRHGAVLDGGRARRVLGYAPRTSVDWRRARLLLFGHA